MNKIYTVAILGCGNRGADSYGKIIFESNGKFRIVALCDINNERLSKYGAQFSVPKENLFLNEEEFFKERRADILIVATQDKDHVRHAEAALKLGYDILLEKPITCDESECRLLLNTQKQYGGKVIVCHVLRYAPAFLKTDELLSNGTVGRLIAIQAIEQVAYWHQAHSYVRGNWRRSEDATPMILAKCCHDLDLLQYYAKSKCVSVSSVGELTYFKSENAPENSSERCLDCALKETCPYSAKRIYLDGWENIGCPASVWPQSVITDEYPLTEAALIKAIEEGEYGRCVFRCDNDVVDHQITQLTFENGVKASLTMTAFTANGGRIIKFYGTLGELVLDEEKNVIEIKRFGEPKEILNISSLNEGGHAHGGGDAGLINCLYDVVAGNVDNRTSLENSLESHLIGICAEKSRVLGGELIYVHKRS